MLLSFVVLFLGSRTSHWVCLCILQCLSKAEHCFVLAAWLSLVWELEACWTRATCHMCRITNCRLIGSPLGAVFEPALQIWQSLDDEMLVAHFSHCLRHCWTNWIMFNSIWFQTIIKCTGTNCLETCCCSLWLDCKLSNVVQTFSRKCWKPLSAVQRVSTKPAWHFLALSLCRLPVRTTDTVNVVDYKHVKQFGMCPGGAEVTAKARSARLVLLQAFFPAGPVFLADLASTCLGLDPWNLLDLTLGEVEPALGRLHAS